jgi:hypothetical protein
VLCTVPGMGQNTTGPMSGEELRMKMDPIGTNLEAMDAVSLG